VTTADGIACILAPNPSPMTGAGTNTYLVAGYAGGCAVIDPGPLIEEHLARVARAAADLGGARAILITHGHPDHAEGAARLRALTGAPILAHGHEVGSARADTLLADGERVTVGERRLIALHTPGHRFDHLCFLLPESGTLFAGDLVAGAGTVVIAPPEGELAAYLASLRRLLALDLRRILPAHGPVIEKPRDLLESYLSHRADRERQVLACLAAGSSDVATLVTRIYASVDPALHGMAALTVTAHLLKLEKEGRVRRAEGTADVEVWQLVS
jgi:glyoxylase-like metal-dependent hydrolase (beta-lactamase superfamily II)